MDDEHNTTTIPSAPQIQHISRAFTRRFVIFWKVNGAKPKKKLQDLLIMYIEKKKCERERVGCEFVRSMRECWEVRLRFYVLCLSVCML